MTTIYATEVKLHSAIRTLFMFIEYIYLWFTAPVIMFRVQFLKSEWYPMKGFKGYYFKNYGNNVIGIRHKRKPGEFQTRLKSDNFEPVIKAALRYFGEDI